MEAKILVVEDEAVVAKDLKETLLALGYRVVAAVDNGTDAIRIAGTLRPDLIIMDVMIKGPLDGIQTAERIHPLGIPIIYLTAHADESIIQRAKITEPFGYIVKPFEEKSLRSTIEMALYKNRSEKEKMLLKEQIIKLSRKISLTENEKLVFYGLVEYPLLNDIELGRLLKIKRSTVTAIRNKLVHEHYIDTYRVPDFSAIGCELSAVIYATLDDLDEKKLQHAKELSKIPEMVFITLTNNALLSIAVSKSFAELKKHIDEMTSLFRREGITDKLSTVYFPSHRCRRFFHYGPYLKKRLEIGFEPQDDTGPSANTVKLTKNDRAILLNLIRLPTLADSQISAATGIPRPSISQTRRKLEQQGILHTMNVPYLPKIGTELLVLRHFSFDSQTPAEKIGLIRDFFQKNSSCIFLNAGYIELCTIDAYEDYSEYHRETAAQGRQFNELGISLISALVFSINNASLMSLDFAALSRKLLQADE
jgi:two-component system, response regulator PdtaR